MSKSAAQARKTKSQKIKDQYKKVKKIIEKKVKRKSTGD